MIVLVLLVVGLPYLLSTHPTLGKVVLFVFGFSVTVNVIAAAIEFREAKRLESERLPRATASRRRK